MTTDNMIRSRLNPASRRQFEELMERLDLAHSHGGESKTIREAINLALKHLDLKKKWFG
tara:strand:+ start:828 stop:1004 length:177 start_codon:yes stop_codon:yes gene_type:complete